MVNLRHNWLFTQRERKQTVRQSTISSDRKPKKELAVGMNTE